MKTALHARRTRSTMSYMQKTRKSTMQDCGIRYDQKQMQSYKEDAG